jgi:hypothetical protein
MKKMHITEIHGQLLYDALEAKYNSQIAESRANLKVYFDKSVGIGEHSDLLPEFDRWVEQLATASDKLEALKSHFVRPADA